jgi:hypothetical protein
MTFITATTLPLLIALAEIGEQDGVMLPSTDRRSHRQMPASRPRNLPRRPPRCRKIRLARTARTA